MTRKTFCGWWFDLQWWKSSYALVMRPNMVETAVQCSVCRMECLPDFPIMVIQLIYTYLFDEVCLYSLEMIPYRKSVSTNRCKLSRENVWLFWYLSSISSGVREINLSDYAKTTFFVLLQRYEANYYITWLFRNKTYKINSKINKNININFWYN